MVRSAEVLRFRGWRWSVEVSGLGRLSEHDMLSPIHYEQARTPALTGA